MARSVIAFFPFVFFIAFEGQSGNNSEEALDALSPYRGRLDAFVTEGKHQQISSNKKSYSNKENHLIRKKPSPPFKKLDLDAALSVEESIQVALGLASSYSVLKREAVQSRDIEKVNRKQALFDQHFQMARDLCEKNDLDFSWYLERYFKPRQIEYPKTKY